MTIMINIQPSELTVVRYVRGAGEPPSLVITEGSTTVWLCPQDLPAGPGWAVEFADRLVTAAAHWQGACRDLASPSRQRRYLQEGHG
ncbi:MAG: hypothetical protein ACREX8_07050 [Gammaproteobacteria bacterium]